jgi:hypothetical protein
MSVHEKSPGEGTCTAACAASIANIACIVSGKTGNRKGAQAELMSAVVEELDDGDMIALSAYLGSLDP